MLISNMSEFLSTCPMINRGRELVTEIDARAHEIGIEGNITCKISSNLLSYLALHPEFTLNKDTEITPEYECGKCRNITFIVSAYLNNSIDILEN